MAGVEVAGLVLGALPLIITAIKTYSDGACKIRDYIKYKAPLTNLSDELATEKTLFENVCEELLDGLVEDSKWKAALLQNPGGDGWSNQQLEEKLKTRLVGSSYEGYLKSMENMKRAVTEIEKLLKLGPGHEVQINANNRFDKEKKRLKFCIKMKYYNGWVAQIRRSRERLNDLTQHCLKVEARGKGPRTLQNQLGAPDLDFSTTQKYASRVYHIIQCGLKCSCRSSHGISLQLDLQKTFVAPKSCGTGDAMQPSFRVVFSYDAKGSFADTQPWNIEAVEIFPADDETYTVSDPGSNAPKQPVSVAKAKVRHQEKQTTELTDLTKRVDSMSGLLSNICIDRPNICLAELLQGNRAVFCTDELLKPKCEAVHMANSVHSSSNPNLVPLREALLLSSDGQYRRLLSNFIKLRISVALAWSFLQLYQTPWSSETWCNSDINLLDLPHQKLLDQPFISRTISESNTHQEQISHHTTSEGPRNRQLFALGILLIELCLGSPFDKLREQLKTFGLPDTYSDYDVANSLLEDVYDEFGDTYGDATLKCIRCEFGCRWDSLSDVRFKRAFYNGVIILLEHNLEVFRSH